MHKKQDIRITACVPAEWSYHSQEVFVEFWFILQGFKDVFGQAENTAKSVNTEHANKQKCNFPSLAKCLTSKHKHED